MNFYRTITAIWAIGFVLYGLYCALQPATVMSLIGYDALTGDAHTEFLSMYGGVQIAIGIFGLAALRDQKLLAANMLLLSVVFLLLALGRAIGYATIEGLGGYSLIAIIFETISFILFLFAYLRIQGQPESL